MASPRRGGLDTRRQKKKAALKVTRMRDIVKSRLASAGGLALLVLGLGLGFLDVPLNIRAVHIAVGSAFIVLSALMIKVQLGRFHRPDKGPGDWVAWMHFVIFAGLFFLAVRMLRRWGACRRAAPVHADDESTDGNKRTPPLIVTYKGQKYDATDFAARHPGGPVIWRAQGRDLEAVWRENGVEWHGDTDYAYIDKMIRSWRKIDD